MVLANLDNLKNVLDIPFPVVVCEHLVISENAQFNGHSVSTSENSKSLIRFPQCQCDILFQDCANIQSFDTLLQDRSIDINAKMATHIGCLAWSPNRVVLWHGSLQPRDPNIKNKLAWYLGQSGFDINQPVNTAQQTLLHLFCKESCSVQQRRTPATVNPGEIAGFLLDQGAKLSARDYLGKTPLHVVSNAAGGSEVMAKLLEHANGNSAIIDAIDDEGITALSAALMHTSWLGKTLLLLRAGASTEKLEDGNSPLHHLIYGGRLNEQSLELLIQFGVDVHEQDSEGAIPINEMAKRINNHEFRNLPCIIRLIKMGVGLNRVDNLGQSLLSVLLRLDDDPYDDGRGLSLRLSKNDKLDLCDTVLKAWYKYNFPERAGCLKGVISDSLMESHEADLAELLADFPDTFYLVDTTVEIISRDLTEHNKRKLENMLVNARDKHPRDVSLLPFVYLPTEHLEYCFSPHFSASEMEAIDSASLADFVRLGLEPDEDDDYSGDSDSDSDEGVVSEISVSEDFEENPPGRNLTFELSDIQLYDWLIETHLESFRRLLRSHHSLYKVISAHEVSLADRLSLENKEKLRELLRDIDRD
ncbi:ankyrin repeat domain-containing protein [Endozoicomonas sp. ONNA2]|uniref:ankyrin repeat domain-containing protein n=1 Tax=Endozoicomonas sp. ONNA2 TaxID=2828741 RepID=UPI002147CC67|nr:hypothetical protein [Endozoicomonas sp. ONNA2]